MNYSLWGETFEVSFKDSDKEDEYNKRYFILSDKDGKSYNFTIKYKMVNGFSECLCGISSIPGIEQQVILYKSLGI